MNAPQDKAAFKAPYRHVGTRPVRPDGVEKVTGKAIYGTDHVAAGMLHGAILRSPHPHARIRSINTKKAEALAGVKAVATGADFPTLASLEVSLGETSGNISNISRNCMAQDKALYEGHAVAAVAATSTQIAEQALALIEVDYEVLPYVLTVAEALAPDAPVLHDDMFTKGLAEKPTKPSNAALRFTIGRGDPDAAIAAAHTVVSGKFSALAVHQGYIEPHACVASWNGDGQAQVWASSQGAFAIRTLCASILGLSQADIRVTPLEIGGGFGGKTTVYLEPVAMVLSRKSGRPVRLAMSRGDVFRASGPAPGGEFEITMGADADGTITGVVLDFKMLGGAFPGSDTHSGAMSALGHYTVANSRVTGWDVLCNSASTAAYRAPGAPQTIFPVESCIDELAHEAGHRSHRSAPQECGQARRYWRDGHACGRNRLCRMPRGGQGPPALFRAAQPEPGQGRGRRHVGQLWRSFHGLGESGRGWLGAGDNRQPGHWR